MKQIGLAVQMYLQDYDDTYFDDGFYDDPTYGRVLWTIPRTPVEEASDPAHPYLLAPYLKNTDVLICSQERDYGQGAFAYRYPQYAINQLPAQGSIVPPDGGRWVGPLSEITPQKTLLRTDSMVDSANTMLIWEHNSTAAECNIWSNSPGHWDTGHQGGFITLWCDGHVKRMTLGKLENRFMTYWAD